MTGQVSLRDAHDNGFTLVELLISLALTVVVLSVAGAILISGLTNQQRVKSVTNAATAAQQIARSVQAGVRNASAITVVNDSTTGTQLLIARVVGADAASTAASCQVWYYTPAGGGAVYTTRTKPAAAIVVPVGGPQGVWALLGTGVTPSGASGQVFTAPANFRLDLSYRVTADSQPYVAISSTTYTPQLPTVSSPCF